MTELLAGKTGETGLKKYDYLPYHFQSLIDCLEL